MNIDDIVECVFLGLIAGTCIGWLLVLHGGM